METRIIEGAGPSGEHVLRGRVVPMAEALMSGTFCASSRQAEAGSGLESMIQADLRLSL